MHVATVQFEPSDDVEANRDRAESLVRKAASRGADLVVLPEIWNVGYFAFDDYAAKAEPIDGPTLTRMSGLASDLGIHLHAGSVVEERGGDLYNTSALFGPDGDRLGTYEKVHLFGYESAEATLLTPGERVVSVDTDLGTVGLSTCYDLRFPELYRALVEGGVDLLLVASAWPHERLEHWDLLTRTRAMETQTILAAANLRGTNEGVDLAGRSRVVDPWGVVRADAGGGEGVAAAEIDPATVQETREEFPVLEDRRTDLDLGD
jgi:predicted amidohydrolase